jgi:hypothetical protein
MLGCDRQAVLDVVYNYQSKHGLRRGSLSGLSSSHPIAMAAAGHTSLSHTATSVYGDAHGSMGMGVRAGSGGGHAALLQTKRPSLTNPMISTSSSPLTGSASNLLMNGPFSPSSPASPPIVLHSTVGMSPSSATTSLGTPHPAVGSGSGGGNTSGAISQHSRTPSGTSHSNTISSSHGNGHGTRAQSSPIAIPSSSSSSPSPSLSPSTT